MYRITERIKIMKTLKNKLVCIFFFFIGCLLFACDGIVAKPTFDNLPAYDGFEEKGEYNLPRNWRVIPAYEGKGEAFMDHDAVQTGNYSLRIKPNNRNTSGAFGVYRMLNADAVRGKEITISGFAKVEGIGDNKAGILFKTDVENWLILPKDTGGKFVSFSKTFSISGKSPDPGVLLLISGTKGSVWFDDLRIYEVKGPIEPDKERSASPAKSKVDSGVKQAPEPSRLGELSATSAILFVSDRDTGKNRTEIYSMDVDGKNGTRLTFTQENHFIMGIDRSRRTIVTSLAEKERKPVSGRAEENRKSLWLLDLRTKEEIRLTDPRNHAEGRSFSPDGEWIVFLMKVSGEEQVDIYKIRRDGSNLTNLTNTPFATEGDPAWSNDGKEIAFTYLDSKTGRFVLKTMDTNGRNIQMIYDGGPGVSSRVFPAGNYDPSWSPDDQWLVFERAVKSSGDNWGSGIWHIFKVRKNGSGIVDLSLAGGHADRAEYLPSFSPDGKYIVLGSIYKAKNPQQSHNGVFLMDSSGGGLRRLMSDPASDKDMYPVWIHKGR